MNNIFILLVIICQFCVSCKSVCTYFDNGDIQKKSVKTFFGGTILKEYQQDGTGSILRSNEKKKPVFIKLWSKDAMSISISSLTIDTFKIEEQEAIRIMIAYSGKFRSYHKNGNIASRGLLKVGEKIGLWKFWDEKKKLIRIEKYSNQGKIIEKE